jgi:urease accessory protein
MSKRATRISSAAVAAVGALAAVVLTAAPASAHTGHPTDGLVDGLTHPVLGPDHLLAMVAVGIIAALVPDRRVAWLTPVGFVVGMVAGGVAGIAGVSIPGVELVVGGSVVLLGLAVLRGAAVTAVWLPAAAAVFGAAHGMAHGGELPEAATAGAYVVGFVVATIVLHAAGVGVGTWLRSRESVRTAAGLLLSVLGAGLLALA